MKQFTAYLKQKNFKKNTIRIYTNYTSSYIRHIQEENLAPEEVRYTDILTFIETLKEQGRNAKNINTHLTAIRHYYKSLKIEKNPAEGVILKTQRKTLPSDILEPQELREIYENYPAPDNRSKRNKVILGLLINQAVTTEELHKLEPRHLLLEKGTIIIPPCGKNRQRTLKLQASQIMELHNYLHKTRPEIIRDIHQKRPARKPGNINKTRLNEQLFISINGGVNLKPSLYHLFREIKKTRPNIKHAKQIRRSVIINKLKTMNLREAQYFAGHRYVSSTEKYKLGNIEELKKQINKYHPLQ